MGKSPNLCGLRVPVVKVYRLFRVERDAAQPAWREACRNYGL